MLSEYEDLKLIDGRQAIVRNGYLPEMTSILLLNTII